MNTYQAQLDKQFDTAGSHNNWRKGSARVWMDHSGIHGSSWGHYGLVHRDALKDRLYKLSKEADVGGRICVHFIDALYDNKTRRFVAVGELLSYAPVAELDTAPAF